MEIPNLITRGQVTSINEEERTVEVVFSKGSRVLRQRIFSEAYYEELSMDPSHIRLDRLNQGAPVLDTHGQWSLEDVIGVVERAWLDGDTGMATIRFSERPDVEPIFQDVKSGILRNISVGYAVHKYEKRHEKEEKIPTLRAVDWEPMEISLVPVGADPSAQIRKDGSLNKVEIVEPKEEIARDAPLSIDEPTKTDEGPMHVTYSVNGNQIRLELTSDSIIEPEGEEIMDKEIPVPDVEQARLEERARVQEIHQVVRQFGLDSALAEELVNDGKDIHEARKAVLDKLAEQSPKTPTHVKVSRDIEKESFRDGVENALLHRSDAASFELSECGRQYVGYSLPELARKAVESERLGSTDSMHRDQIVTRALATADFPGVLASVANKSLQRGYQAAPQTFRAFVSQRFVNDFKTISSVQLGDAPSLEVVNENGEYKRGAVSEGKEEYKLKTYGKVLHITRQVILNDDLGAFANVPAMFGRAVADLESEVVYAFFNSAHTMGDGVALFHADHGNLASSDAEISVDTISAGRSALRTQTSLDGRKIRIAPKYLLVGPEKETKAQQILMPVASPATVGANNPFAGALQLIVEPNLSVSAGKKPWFLIADPAQVGIVEIANLQGQPGPVIETRNGFDVDGVEIKCRRDFGAKPIDFRGVYKNGGAT